MPSREDIEFEVAAGTPYRLAKAILESEEAICPPLRCDCELWLRYHHGIGGYKCRACGNLYDTNGERI